MAVAIGQETHIGGLRIVNYNKTAANLKHASSGFESQDKIGANNLTYTNIDIMFDPSLSCYNKASCIGLTSHTNPR